MCDANGVDVENGERLAVRYRHLSLNSGRCFADCELSLLLDPSEQDALLLNGMSRNGHGVSGATRIPR